MVLTRVKWPNVVLMTAVGARARTGTVGGAAMWARVWACPGRSGDGAVGSARNGARHEAGDGGDVGAA